MLFADTVKTAIAIAVKYSIGFNVYVYSGSMPSDAQTAPTGVLLVTLVASSQTVTGGVIDLGNMTGTADATGAAGYAMMTEGSASSNNRIYLTLATSAAELTMSSLDIVSGDVISGTGSITVIA